MLLSSLLRRTGAPRATACSTALSQRGVRCAQLSASIDSSPIDENPGEAAASASSTCVPHDTADPSASHSLIANASVPTPIATAMALAEQLEHPGSSKLGQSLASRPDWLLTGAESGLTNEELIIAKSYLDRLRETFERDYQPTPERTAEELQSLRAKGMTPRLGRMLVALVRMERYKEIEGIAFLWEEAFPEFARNGKHWSVICEHFASSLIKQKRPSEVVETFFTNWFAASIDDSHLDAYEQILFTPFMVSLVLKACGQLKDADTIIRVLQVAQERHIKIREKTYFRILDDMLRDAFSSSGSYAEATETFHGVMRICDTIVHDVGHRVPQAILPVLIRAAAERGHVRWAVALYTHPGDKTLGQFAEYHFELCLFQLWEMQHVPEMFSVLERLLDSTGASDEFKTRICKALLVKTATGDRDRDGDHHHDHHDSHDSHEVALAAMRDMLELMETHQIRASAKPLVPLLTSLLDDDDDDDDDHDRDDHDRDDHKIQSVEDFRAFFAQYPHVLQWNEVVICELLLLAVRRRRVKLIDELVGHALDNGIAIKYVALESVVAFYYRAGRFASVEKVAKIVHAMRQNRHIPLGMSLTEIGMTCNLQLKQYEEVAMLFEDFAWTDGERQRVRTRKPMLYAAIEAYTKLKRYDQATAVSLILHEYHRPPLPPKIERQQQSRATSRVVALKEVEMEKQKSEEEQEEGSTVVVDTTKGAPSEWQQPRSTVRVGSKMEKHECDDDEPMAVVVDPTTAK